MNKEKKAIYFLLAFDPSTLISSYREFLISKKIKTKKTNNRTTFDISNDCRLV